MSGPEGRPLLVLDQVGKGRVAELLSDRLTRDLIMRAMNGHVHDYEL